MHPINPLTPVLLLLPLQDQLNEQLLQFLIAVVDTELLEPVHSKHFEAIDVQYTDDCVWSILREVHSYGTVDTAHNELEQSLIQGL